MASHSTLFLLLSVIFCCTYAISFAEVSEGSGEDPLLSSTNEGTITQYTQNDPSLAQHSTFFDSTASEPCLPKVDLIFVIDTSGSIEQVYERQINLTLSLIDDLAVSSEGIRIATIQYAKVPVAEFSLGSYTDTASIKKHLMKINFQAGVTRTGYALRKADSELFDTSKGARPDARKVIVLFTDGLSVDDPLRPADQLRTVKNVSIFVITVGSDGFEPEMKRIAGDASRVFGPKDLNGLRAAIAKTVSESPTSCDEDKWFDGKEASADTNAIYSSTTAEDTHDVGKPTKSRKFQIQQAVIAQPQVTAIPEEHADEILNTDENEENHTEEESENTSKDDSNTASTDLTQSTVNDESEESSDKLFFSSLDDSENIETTSEISSSISQSESIQATAEGSSRLTSQPRARNTSISSSTSVRTITTTSPKPRKQITTQAVRKASPAPRTSISQNLPSTTRTPIHRQTASSLQSRFSGAKNSGDCALDILFIVDSSGSVQYIYDQQKEYLLSILSQIQVGEHSQRVALLQFAGSTHQRTEWTFDTFVEKEAIMQAFSQIRHFTGTTYIGRALEVAQNILDQRRKNTPTIVVLVSDGFSQDDATKPAAEIRRLSNLEFYTASVSELNN